jgi:hypothetical protein
MPTAQMLANAANARRAIGTLPRVAPITPPPPSPPYDLRLTTHDSRVTAR